MCSTAQISAPTPPCIHYCTLQNTQCLWKYLQIFSHLITSAMLNYEIQALVHYLGLGKKSSQREAKSINFCQLAQTTGTGTAGLSQVMNGSVALCCGSSIPDCLARVQY